MARKVHVSIVLDRSGSMARYRVGAADAVNGAIQRVQAERDLQARISLVLFDGQGIDTIRDRVPAASCVPFGLSEFKPGRGTPLLDAVGYSAGLLDCLCKYPPAKPGALGLEPLEAAGGVADAAPRTRAT